MTDEGVIKFQLEHTPAEPLSREALAELERWRGWMYERGLIGVVATEHGPIGYGNISTRHPGGFIISGSQTGHLPHLEARHYTLVTAADPAQNRLTSRGPIQPSSESLTHAVVYEQDRQINWVLHAHCRPVWLAAARLGIPQTAPDVAYGTPEMAAETARLFVETNVKEIGMFAMAGHEDGIVSFGETAVQAAGVMEQYLRLAG